ncbi:MAG: PKD repeat protein, partial [Saprospiraceae bacterium]
MLRIKTLAFCMFLMAGLFGQNSNFKAGEVQLKKFAETLDSEFNAYNLYQLDFEEIDQYVRSAGEEINFSLQLGNDYDWKLNLYPNDIRGEDYHVYVQTENGVEIYPQRPNMTFRGYLNEPNSGKVGLTINDHHFAGTVNQNGILYFIEPLHYLIKDAPRDIIIAYLASDVKPHEGLKCGADEFLKQSQKEYDKHKDHDHSDTGDSRMTGLCLEVDLAIASDYLMYLDYNSSVTQVEDHNITVMNNVANNWDDEFDDEIVFKIVTQFVSDCNTCDPWTSSTNAGTFLLSFRNWGQSGGFGVPFDLGQIWTDRNFDGGTVGVAYLDGVCGSFKYHALQDFTTNSQLLRVMTSHEIGHNFDAFHDAPNSGFIMAPSVNNTSVWSTSSQNAINATITQRYNSGCFAECSNVPPPVADFVADQTSGCIPLGVQFTDLSINDPTQWTWTFPGGTPASSNDPNPFVTYNTGGTYDVTLSVTNAGGTNTLTKTAYISALDVPLASFSYTTNQNMAFFFNSTPNGSTYNWDFGDGMGGTEVNPVHDYAEDGEYTVTLTATNVCGVSVFTDIVIIATLPVANFTSNVTNGCPPLVIGFEDLSSSNTDFWVWNFPGGSPDQSVEQNPVVVYNNPGTYDVTLTVINETGSNTITIQNYITVAPLPVPDFTYNVNGLTIDFTNASIDANTYLWLFGDGDASSLENPSHTYSSGGSYLVSLTAYNDCGNATYSILIELESAPTAGIAADILTGCAPLTVHFLDNSSPNVDTWEWSFPGGNPTSSIEQNPIVVYENPGTFDVTLTVTNSIGSSTVTETNYIIVDDVPVAGFTSITNNAIVDFTNTSTNATSYSWDFGDGNSSTLESPSHTYDNDGVYTVILTGTNTCGSVTTTEQITIVTPPLADFSANVTSGCVELTVEFSDESSTNATSWLWTFDGGNPGTSTDQNPTVIYNTAGTYSVTLEVTNSAGSSTVTETNYIIVDDVPVAGFTSITNNAIVDFTNTSTNATSYSWDFGDGNSSTLESPSHTYDNDGVYTVILTATNTCGSVTTTEQITIVTPPTAGFSANINSGCAELTVEFSDESTANATSWLWTFDGGNPDTSTDQNPTVIYNTAGTYSVTLEVTNSAGSNTVTETNYIIVDDVPVAGFTSITNNAIVDFTNTSTNATSYSWDFGDGNSSTLESPSHTYDNDGVYTVILTAINTCGSVTTTEQITIVTPPTAGFSANINSGCAELTVEFSDESTANATSWLWTFDGGNPDTSTDQNPTVIYNTAGTYSVTLEVTNSAGSNTVTETNYIIVDDVPVAGFTSITNNAIVDFTNTSTNATSYSWDFGDGNSSTLESPSHTYDNDGTYTVILTATNTCGSVTMTQEVNIGTLPTASFTANITSGCSPLTVSFTDQSSVNTIAWDWTFEGGTPATSSMQHPIIIFDQPGIYTVTLTAMNSAGSNTSTQVDYIVVNTIPAAGFTANTNGTITNFTNTSTNATSYSWDFGDGGSSAETNPEHDFQTDGVYTVELTASNECGSITNTETVTIVTAPTAAFSADVTNGCASLTVQFNDLSSSNTTSWSWTFEGGNPATSSAQNPQVTFDAAGSYMVTLEVSNPAGSNEVIEMNYIVVNDVPDANFTVSSSGQNFEFTNTSTNSTSVSWDFGDGNSSTEENPMHSYAADGDYEVTLTASNECGSTTTSQTVTAVIAPVAGFSANITSGCAPLTVEFMDQSIGIVASYNWSFPGGNPSSSTAENPVVVYENPGIYTVELEVTNSSGSNTAVQTNYIIINTVPSAGFTGIIAGTGITFTNTTTGATGYNWDFGDGNVSDDTNPVHDFVTDGIYTVVLTAENECGTVTYTETFEIVTEPLAGFNADVTSGCADLMVNFMDQSSANTTSWLWTFEGGDPSSSIEQNPTVLYDTPGSYNVTLVATTSAGSNTYTQNQFIIVNTVPSVDFSTMINGATVNFLNNSIGATSYLWDFGDSNMSTMANPEHTYTNDGDYTVTLTAINDCGETTTTQNISVVSFPVAVFSADVTTGCGPLTVNFIDLSTGNVSAWDWTFPGGTPASSTAQNPAIVYETPGAYAVTLEVTNSAGTAVQTITSYIVVQDIPQPGFTATITGSTAIFTNTSIGGTSFVWDFGDGSESMEENPFYIYDEDGMYTVTLTVTNSCGTATTTKQVLIITPPTALFTADTIFGCVPLVVQYTNQSSENAAALLWTFEGGTPVTSTDQNPLVTYNTVGVFDVSLTASNPAGNNTAVETDYIVVGDVPTADFTSLVTGITVDFTNISSNGNIYDWDFGDGGMSTDPNPSHEYPGAGDYEVSLTVTNDCGSSTIKQTVSIAGQAPAAGFNADVTDGCLPFTVNFEDTSMGEPSAWSWSFPGGSPNSSSDQNPTVIYNSVGSYEVSLMVTNGFGESTLIETDYIIVNDVPQVDFDYEIVGGGNVEFSNTTSGATSYEWTFGDGGTSTEENPIYQYTQTGMYTVILTAFNDCGDVKIETVVDVIITGLEEFENIEVFSLYPNPNNGKFTLVLEGQDIENLEL